MKPIAYRFLVLIVLFFGISCTNVWSQQAPKFPDGEIGLMELGYYLVQANEEERKLLTDSLRPLASDYNMVFKGKYAKRVRKYHTKYWKRNEPVMRPYHRYQTEPHCWATTPDSLKSYEGNARQFPGGYREMAHHFQEGITLYRLKLVKPGMRLGTSFDAFIYVNGRWRIFPRPWVVHAGLRRE